MFKKYTLHEVYVSLMYTTATTSTPKLGLVRNELCIPSLIALDMH